MAMTPKEAIARIKKSQIRQINSIVKQNQATNQHSFK